MDKHALTVEESIGILCPSLSAKNISKVVARLIGEPLVQHGKLKSADYSWVYPQTKRGKAAFRCLVEALAIRCLCEEPAYSAIAANQVGLDLPFFVSRIGRFYLYPRFEPLSDERTVFFEGCGSLGNSLAFATSPKSFRFTAVVGKTRGRERTFQIEDAGIWERPPKVPLKKAAANVRDLVHETVHLMGNTSLDTGILGLDDISPEEWARCTPQNLYIPKRYRQGVLAGTAGGRAVLRESIALWVKVCPGIAKETMLVLPGKSKGSFHRISMAKLAKLL